MTLGELRDAGIFRLAICCLGWSGQEGGRACTYSREWPIEVLIRRYGRTQRLVGLARRARCGSRGCRGAHIEPVLPRVKGPPGSVRWRTMLRVVPVLDAAAIDRARMSRARPANNP